MIKIPLCPLPHGQDLPRPAYMTPGSAGMDLLAAVTEAITLNPKQWALIPTALTLAIPPGWEAQIRPRSGLAYKYGVTVLNAPGTIDADYRGEVGVLLINLGEKPFIINRGERVAQMILAPVTQVEWVETTTLETSSRGHGGFGHTGR